MNNNNNNHEQEGLYVFLCKGTDFVSLAVFNHNA